MKFADALSAWPVDATDSVALTWLCMWKYRLSDVWCESCYALYCDVFYRRDVHDDNYRVAMFVIIISLSYVIVLFTDKFEWYLLTRYKTNAIITESKCLRGTCLVVVVGDLHQLKLLGSSIL